MLGGFLCQQVIVDIDIGGDDAVFLFLPLVFEFGGGCPSSGGLSPACVLHRLGLTLVQREILKKLLWLSPLLAAVMTGSIASDSFPVG
jgi:hypothetical protein